MATQGSPRARPDSVLGRIAAQQHSVFDRRQAVAAGLSPRMIQHRLESGRWVSVSRGVYRLAGVERTWHQRVLAACLAAGAGAVASHRSAAALWEIDGFGPGPVEISVSRSQRRTAHFTTHRPRNMWAADTTELDYVPVTTVARTIIDLAAVVGDDDLEAALD